MKRAPWVGARGNRLLAWSSKMLSAAVMVPLMQKFSSV